MQDLSIRDIMVPLDRCTTIGLDASLCDAIRATERALAGDRHPDADRLRDLVVLVLDADGQVVGRLLVWDVLRGLETQLVKRVDALSMVDGFGAWRQPLANLTGKIQDVSVKNLVTKLAKGEIIDVEMTLNEALHRLITKRLVGLIVTEQKEAVGVVRVVDVFARVHQAVQEVDTAT
ncbi:MAG: CBS domain-containing protein [Planctomycetota bacterium]|jgi:hypothetical protein